MRTTRTAVRRTSSTQDDLTTDTSSRHPTTMPGRSRTITTSSLLGGTTNTPTTTPAITHAPIPELTAMDRLDLQHTLMGELMLWIV